MVCPFTAPSHAKPRLQGWGFCRSEPLDAMSAIGTKQTSPSAVHMSAFDPKQTFNSARFSFLSKTLSHLPKFSIVSGSKTQPTWCFFEYGREQADIS